jgi:hypothetical protein
MAETYGEIPQKFTRAWWSHFWYYYKWRVIITAAALLIAAVTIVQCVTRPKYDMYITYAGHTVYSESMSEKLQDVFAKYVTDVDGNGKQAVLFRQMTFYDTAGNEEMDSAMQTKLDFTFTEDCNFIYLMDRAEVDLYINRDSTSRLFESADTWAQDTSAEILTSDEGTAYAVNLKDSSLLKENDIYCEDLYLLVRTNSKKDSKNIQAHEDALKLAKELIK